MARKKKYSGTTEAQIALSDKYKTKEPNTNQRTKGSQISNTKYELRINQRESHKSNLKVATCQKRANHQTA